MEKLRIEWETGYMEFCVDEYFPFALNKAKKMFELINKNCSFEVKAELKNHLEDRAKAFDDEMDLYANKAVCFPPKSKECKFYTTRFNNSERLYKRTLKNLKLLDI